MIMRLLGLLLVWSCALQATDNTALVPSAYQGRIRPLEATARLWLYDLYHRQQLRAEDLAAFHTSSRSAVDLYWSRDRDWQHAPLFWIQHATTKQVLGLDLKENRFSFEQLRHAFVDHEQSNAAVTDILIRHHYQEAYQASSNRAGATRLELTNLASGLWIAAKDDKLVVVQVPSSEPWHRLQVGQVLYSTIHPDKAVVDELIGLWHHVSHFNKGQDDHSLLTEAVSALQSRGMKPTEIAQVLETQLPLRKRLLDAGSELRVLPGRLAPGEWYALKALNTQVYDVKKEGVTLVSNFTLYPDALFERLRTAYLTQQPVAQLLSEGYDTLAGERIQEGGGKTLHYPTQAQLKAEMWYYRLPLPLLTLAAYALAAMIFGLAFSLKSQRLRPWAWSALTLAWTLHTTILVLRCYILARPPVANMFETVVYVPWIAVMLSLALFLRFRSLLLPLAASLLSVILLALLEVTQLHNGLETVQPVLDSQYWLIIHVLLVVASYGVFLLSGILGHAYLIMHALHSTHSRDVLAKAILHSMYLGTAMLVSGTILGGVWAAESWGRFWDWDPKESWAFISSCVYLVFIHAYTFNQIRDVGLAVGSIVGLWAISFTWYGVNYILGTGLHSYGFGSGGEGYYYGFLISEAVFVVACLKSARYVRG